MIVCIDCIVCIDSITAADDNDNTDRTFKSDKTNVAATTTNSIVTTDNLLPKTPKNRKAGATIIYDLTSDMDVIKRAQTAINHSVNSITPEDVRKKDIRSKMFGPRSEQGYIIDVCN